MHYVAQAQHSTSVTQALKCDLLEPDVDCLVVCKYSRLELHILEVTGLKLVWEESLFGAVEHLCSVKPKDAVLSSLLVVSTNLKLYSIALDPTSTKDRPRLVTTSSVSLARQGSRIATELITTAVDPLRRCTISHVLNGELYVVPLTGSSKSASAKVDISKGFCIRIPELNVYSLEFAYLPETIGPTIIYLYSDNTGRMRVRTRTIDLRRKCFDEQEAFLGSAAPPRARGPSIDAKTASMETPDDTHRLLIPVAGWSIDSDAPGNREGGAILVGEESAVFLSCAATEDERASPESSPKGKGKAAAKRRISTSSTTAPSEVWSRTCDLPIGDVKCWANVIGEPDTFLIGDTLGKLHLLKLSRGSSGRVEKLSATDLGDVSAPEQLVHLEGGFVFVGSHSGDSQLVTIPLLTSGSGQAPTADTMDVDAGEAGAIDVIVTWTNLAPIVDFCVVDEPALGQNHLVTCSGLQQDGSLRLVRHDVGLKDLGALEWAGVQRVWPLRLGSNASEAEHDSLLLSLVDSTRVLSFAADGIEELEHVDGFKTNEHTLAAGMAGRTAVQVTPSGVGSSGGARWAFGGSAKVTVAAVDGTTVIAATEGGELRKVQVTEDGRFAQVGSAHLEHDIACLNVSEALGFVTVGQWTANNVVILSTNDLSVLAVVPTDSTYHLRSLLLASFSDIGTPYLFVGLGDGSLVTAPLERVSGQPLEGGRKSVALGTRPVTMAPFAASEGVPSVLVNSDRPTVVTFANDRLRYASVNVADVVTATAFDAEEFRNSLVLATADGMRIARIDELQRMHVATLPLEGEQPRRIAHSATLKAFGIICIREDLDRDTGEESQLGSLKIIDDSTFAVLLDFPFEPNEQGLSITLAPLGSPSEEHFVIGTAEYVADGESKHGRVLAFRYLDEGSYELAYSVDALGAVHDVTPLPGGKLAGCANAFVHVWEPTDAKADDDASGPGGSFDKISSWGGAFISYRLACIGNTILVNDIFRSVIMLSYDEKLGTLTEEARDYNAYGARALAALDEKEFISSDVDLNVFTVGTAQPAVGGLAHVGALSSLGRFHIGDNINKFAAGSLVPRFVGEHAPGKPKLVYATSTGAIGVIAEVVGETATLLSSLERNMRGVIKGLGDTDQSEYRMFKKDKRDQEAAGFVDGDFVQTFVDLVSADDAIVERIVEGGSAAERLTTPKGEIVRVLEELARLH